MARDRQPVRGVPVPAQAAPPSADRGAALPADAQAAALVGVMATLTQQLAVQAGALSANTAALVNATRQGRGVNSRPDPPRPMAKPGMDIAGKLAGSLQSFALQIVAPLAPLAALAQTLSATTSGFGTFLKMTQLVTVSLAGLFLPAMLVASGVMFALAQAIQGPLLNAILGAAPQVIALMEAAKGAADATKDVTTLFKELGGEVDLTKSGLVMLNELLNVFGLSVKDAIRFLTLPTLSGVVGGLKSDKPNMLQRAGAGINDMLFDLGIPVPRYQPTPGPPKPREMEWWNAPPGDPDRTDPDVPRPKGKPAPTAPGSGGSGGTASDMLKGMRLALDSMKREVGGPAQMGTDLAGVWWSAVLAGVQEDPIQKEMRDLMARQVDATEKMLGEVQRKEAQYRSRS